MNSILRERLTGRVSPATVTVFFSTRSTQARLTSSPLLRREKCWPRYWPCET